MRKVILLQLVTAYDEQKQKEKKHLFQQDLPQIDLLKQFLKTERIKQLNDQDNISFHKDFLEFLDDKQRHLFSKNFFEKPTESAELFRKFIKSR